MKPDQSFIDQVTALAGVAQSIKAVQNIAWKGSTSDTDLKAVIASLLRVDAETAIAVYDGTYEVNTGLRLVKQQLDASNRDKDPEFVHHAINLMTLQKQVESNSRVMENLSKNIVQIASKYNHLNFYQDEEVFEQLLEECSMAYEKTISTLPNRIKVKGEPRFLESSKNQVRVRAALLSAIRSLFLWRQSGGSRWHFIFKKKLITNAANYLLKNPSKS